MAKQNEEETDIENLERFQNEIYTSLDIQIRPEVRCLGYVFGLQICSQEAFGCTGLNFHRHVWNPCNQVPVMEKFTFPLAS